MHIRIIAVGIFYIITLSAPFALADQLDSILPMAKQQSCGLTKLTQDERANLLRVFVELLVANEPERAARLYVENQLGLSSEIDIDSVRGNFLILTNGAALQMLDTSSFSDSSTYLADDDVSPSEVLDAEGVIQEVVATYSDVEEALEAE